MEHVLFLHIPKTGGQSLTALFKSADERCNPANPSRFLQETDWTSANSMRFFFSHAPLYVRQILPTPLFVFTFLRNPVDRMISHYNHILRSRNTKHYEIIVGERLGLIDALSHPDVTGELNNFATRLLGLDLNLGAVFPDVDLMLVANSTTLATAADEFIYRRALKRLGEINFVGFTERFEVDCRALAAQLDIDRQTIPFEGMTPDDFDCPLPKAVRCPEVEAAVEKHSFFDCRLYDRARSFFWSHEGASPKSSAREHFSRLASADAFTLFGANECPHSAIAAQSLPIDEDLRLAARGSQLLRAERLIDRLTAEVEETHRRAGMEIAARDAALGRAEKRLVSLREKLDKAKRS